MSKKKYLDYMNDNEFFNEIKAIMHDPSKFLKYCQILTSKGFSTFKPYNWQKKQLQKFGSTLGTKRPNHIVIAPRQVGKTAMIAAYVLWYALCHDNKCVGLISFKKAAAIEILRIIREMYIYLPKSLQLDKKVWTKECVQFSNNTKIIIGNCQANSIRGRALDLVVVDEAAHVSNKDFKNFMMSVFPSQACRPDSQMIFITTPKYKNSEFHELYEHAITRGDQCSLNVTHLKWNCISKRNAEWKKKMKAYYDEKMFKSEYLAEFIDE